MISMGALLEGVSWLGQALVVFGASFDGPWFGAVGPIGKAVSGETFEQGIEKLSPPSRADAGAGHDGRPLPDPGDGSLEGDTLERSIVSRGGFKHERSNEVVRNLIHGQLFVNHLGSLAAKNVHAEGGLDVAQEEFGQPASPVEFDKGVLGKCPRIEQCGDNGNGLGSESRDLNAEMYLPQRKAVPHGAPCGRVDPFGTRG